MATLFKCVACGHELAARHKPCFCDECGLPDAYCRTDSEIVNRAIHASEISNIEPERTPTGDSSLDAVLGGGLVVPSTSTAFGAAGVGKSRSCLRWACHMGKTLLVSLEMPSQLAIYSARSARANVDNLYVIESEDWREEAFRLKPVVVIIDSFHYSSKQKVVPGTKVARVFYELSEWSKANLGIGIMIAHQNKKGRVSGTTGPEHWPDYLFKFEKHGASEAKVVIPKSRYAPSGSAVITI